MGIVAKSAARIRWPAQQQVPLNGAYRIYRDDGAGGGIDYDTPCNADPIAAWPDGEGKMGAGLGPAGSGAAGYGYGAYLPGAGEGAAGLGMAGFGADWHEWITAELADATYLFAVVGLDAAGNLSETPADVLAAVTLAAAPDPPGVPSPTAYEKGTDTLTLGWPLSADDEG